MVSACGLSFSQGWFVCCAILAEGYRSGLNLFFIMGPVWLGYCIGLAGVLVYSRFSKIRLDASQYLAVALAGSIVMISSYSIAGSLGDPNSLVIGASAFMGFICISVGSGGLETIWIRILGCISLKDANEVCRIVFCAVALCTLLIPIFALLGHSVWAALLEAGLLCLSYAGLATHNLLNLKTCAPQESQKYSANHTSVVLPIIPFRKRVFVHVSVVGILLGGSFSLMIAQFLGADFGHPLSLTWLFACAGCFLVGSTQIISHRYLKSNRSLHICIVAAISCIIAFFPINAGTDFSLKFAMAGATCALWVNIMTLALALPWIARNSSANFEQLYRCVRITSLMAAGVCAPLGLWISQTTAQEVIVHVSAIVSIVGCCAAMLLLYTAPIQFKLPQPVKQPDYVSIKDSDGKLSGLPDTFVMYNNDASLHAVAQELGQQYNLTRREIEVLEILSQGYDTKRITEELNISEGTALTHRLHIFQKLDIHSRIELLDMIFSRLSDRDTD